MKGTNNFNTISHVLGNISQEEKSILDKVYDRVIESLEQLNTKKEEYIVNELNSFNWKTKFNQCGQNQKQ